MINKGDLKYGDVVWADFDPSVGHEYKNRRPAIIVQSDKQLRKSNLATIIALTSNLTNNNSDDVLIKADVINKLTNDSLAKVRYIATFDYRRFIKKIGKISNKDLQKIKKYLKIHFEI
ncbi:MAG: type II toxin-antitoxin system PemK/MazF family toxin [Candidatus Paceibacterota bacterium]